jgi:hypothetical protein
VSPAGLDSELAPITLCAYLPTYQPTYAHMLSTMASGSIHSTMFSARTSTLCHMPCLHLYSGGTGQDVVLWPSTCSEMTLSRFSSSFLSLWRFCSLQTPPGTSSRWEGLMCLSLCLCFSLFPPPPHMCVLVSVFFQNRTMVLTVFNSHQDRE